MFRYYFRYYFLDKIYATFKRKKKGLCNSSYENEIPVKLAEILI